MRDPCSLIIHVMTARGPSVAYCASRFIRSGLSRRYCCSNLRTSSSLAKTARLKMSEEVLDTLRAVPNRYDHRIFHRKSGFLNLVRWVPNQLRSSYSSYSGPTK
jgi:hypothetical protein